MKKVLHRILDIIFILGWVSFCFLQLYHLIPTLTKRCVFWGGNSAKPADVNYIVFLFCIFLSLTIGTIIFHYEKNFFQLNFFKKVKIILINAVLAFIWGYVFYVETKEISANFGIAQFECFL